MMNWFWAQRSPGLDAAFPVLTRIGSLAVLGPLALAGAAYLLWRREASEAAFLAASVFGSAAAAHLAKLAIARPRPDLHAALVAVPADGSFPSAHAAQAAAFAAALLWLLARRRSPWTGAVAALSVLTVALTCASRVYLQVHYPSDVAAGALGGLLWALTVGACLPLAVHGRRGAPPGLG